MSSTQPWPNQSLLVLVLESWHHEHFSGVSAASQLIDGVEKHQFSSRCHVLGAAGGHLDAEHKKCSIFTEIVIVDRD